MSAKLTVVPVVPSWMAMLAASTVPAKFAPPELVSVRLPICVPTAPLTLTTPPELNVRLVVPAPAVPLMVPVLMLRAEPVPSVKCLPLAIVRSANVMAPVDVPPTLAVSVTVVPTPPKSIAPVPAEVIAPAMRLVVGAVATTPPTNAVLSLAWSPTTSVPVWSKVVVPAMLLFAPSSETL